MAPLYNPIAPFVLVHVTRERKELYESIDRRVHEMFNAGWIEEVESLTSTAWQVF